MTGDRDPGRIGINLKSVGVASDAVADLLENAAFGPFSAPRLWR
jgi:hypothetical protein